jgi:hypothetical protein
MGHILVLIYRKTFWHTYDHIGTMILANLIWFLTFPVPTFLFFRYIPLPLYPRLGLTLALGLCLNAWAGSGAFGIASAIADYREAGLGDFTRYAGRFFLRMLALTVIYIAAFTLLAISTSFYLHLEAGSGILGFFLAGVQAWIALFLLLMKTYLTAILFRKDWGVGRTLKWAAMLVVLRPGLTFLLYLQAVAIFAIVSLTGVGLVLLTLTVTGVFLNTALREVLRDMERRMTPRKKPTSWKEIFAERDREEEEPRRLKDLFRPWDH